MADTNDIRDSGDQLNNSFTELYNTLDAITDEISGITSDAQKNAQLVNQASSAYKNILKSTQKLKDDQDKINKLSNKDLRNLRAKVRSNISLIQRNADQIRQGGQLTARAKALLAAKQQQFDIEKQLTDQLETRIKTESSYESALGLTGATLENLNRIGIRAFGGFGLNLGAFSAGFDEAREAAEAAGTTISESLDPGKPASFTQKLKVMKAALPGIMKAFKEGLNDPAALLLGLVKLVGKAFNEVQEEVVTLGRLTGDASTAFATFNTRVATTVDVLKIANSLTKSIGLSANAAFSSQTLAAAAEYQNTLGLSAEEAGKLAFFTEATGRNLDNSLESAVSTVSAFNRTNRTAISQGVVLRDIATTSDGITASFVGQAGAIAEAAASARRLGLELNRLDAVASSLLEFETSIEKELEAEVLTGRQLNLERARELALSNDLAGVGREIFENSVSIAEFGSLNRIQQEAQAAALGLSRDELARIAYLRGIEVGLTSEQAALAADVSLNDMQRMTIQEQFNKALQKAVQLLAPIADLFTMLTSNSIVFYGTLAAIAAISFVKLLAGLVPLVTALGGAAVAAGILRTLLGGAVVVGLALGAGALIGSTVRSSQSKVTTVGDALVTPSGDIIKPHEQDYKIFTKDPSSLGRSDEGIIRELRELKEIMKQGGDVNLNGYKVGTAFRLAESRL